MRRRSSIWSMGAYGVLTSQPSSAPGGFPSDRIDLNIAFESFMSCVEVKTSMYTSVSTSCPEGLWNTTRIRIGGSRFGLLVALLPLTGRGNSPAGACSPETTRARSVALSSGSSIVNGISTSTTPAWRRRLALDSIVSFNASTASSRVMQRCGTMLRKKWLHIWSVPNRLYATPLPVCFSTAPRDSASDSQHSTIIWSRSSLRKDCESARSVRARPSTRLRTKKRLGTGSELFFFWFARNVRTCRFRIGSSVTGWMS
mmetsp:Transcript_62888/g.149891  ORF Transcript_62888/g.149891 Transcript_62888/m.149891 type:complete len:257 (-) Transcript_62888:278-1048(-)